MKKQANAMLWTVVVSLCAACGGDCVEGQEDEGCGLAAQASAEADESAEEEPWDTDGQEPFFTALESAAVRRVLLLDRPDMLTGSGNVLRVNIPPVANAGPDQNAVDWQVVTLTATGSYDPDSGPSPLTYAWSQTGGSLSVTLNNPNSVSPTFKVPIIVNPETLTFKVHVCDGADCSDDYVGINIDHRTRATVGLLETWESGVFQPYWVTDGRNGGLNEITSSYTPTHGGSYHLIQRATAYYGLSELILFTNLNALDNVYLDFWHKRYTSDSISNMPVSFTGSQDYDGVAISNDGNTWYRVTPSSWNTYTSYTKNSYRLDTISGVTMNSKVLIKFQRYDYYYSGYYFGWDDIELYRNRTPVAEAGDFQQVNEGTLVTLTGSGSSDPDGDTLTYTWTKTVGPKTITLSNPNAANPTFTAPSPIWADETYTFQLQVCDPRGLCSTDTVNVVVKDSVPNTVPTVNAGSDLNKVEWEYVTITAVGSDSDGGPSTLTYSWTQTGGPTVVGLSGQNTATINFRTPLVTAGGQTVTFQVQVYDGVAYGSDTVAVNIAERTRTTTGLNETWESGVFQPYWVTDGRNGGLNEITSSYTPTHGGSYHLIQRATAYYGLSELILFTNLNALDNVYLDFWHKRYTSDSISNMPVSFTGSQDYDGVAISNDGNTWYRVTPSSWNTYTSYTKNSYRLDTISGVTMNSKVLIKFQRYDYYYSGYYFGWDDIELYRNRTPVANAGSDQTNVAEGSLVTLNGSASSDPDNDTLTYAWTKTSGPSVTLNGANTANPTFTAPSPIWADVTFTFQLQVCDPRGLCSTDSVDVIVKDTIPNTVPTVNAGADLNKVEWEYVTITAVGSDSDGGPSTLTYSWTQTGGPTVVGLSGQNTATINFRTPLVTAGGQTVTFQVQVYDGVAYGSDTVAVNIAERTRTTTGLNETWESGVFQPYWVTDGRNGGLNEITSSYTPTRGGSYHLIQRATAYYGLSELILFTNLNALDNVYLDFWHKRYTSDSISNMPVSFTGSQDYDGVAISNDGNTWYRVTPSSWNTYTSYTKNSYRLDTISGVTMNSKVLIKFQRYDYYYSGYYFGWDDIELYRNRTPVAEAGDFQQVNEGTLVTLTGSGSSDPDGDTLTYTWTKTVGPKTIMLSNPNAANPTFTAPSPIWADETYTFQLQVCDPRGLCSTDTVNVVVKDSVPNTVPTVNAGADLNKVEWEYVTITAVGSDSDGGPSTLTYSWTQTGGPTVVGLSGQNTATINFRTPLVTAGGQTVTFQVQVYDGVAYGSDTVAVNIAERTRTTTGLNETWESGVFQPYWVTDGRNGGLNEITSSYTPTHGGSYHLIQRATAYYGLSELILFTNLNALDNVYLDFWHKRYTSDSISNMPVSFTGSQDYDGVAISNDGNTWYRVTPSSWNTYTSYTKNSYRLDTISGVTMNSKVLIKFQRYDYYYSGYYFGWDDIELYRNRTPVANAGSDQTNVAEGSLVTLNGSASSDPDNDTLTYAWTKTSGPSVTLNGANTANPTFTAPSPIWADVTFTFQLQVCDPRGLCSTDSVDVIVKDTIPNTVPTVNAGADLNKVEWEYVTITAVGSDSDGGPSTLTYSWTQTGGPTVVGLSGQNTATINFRTPLVTAGGQTVTFQVQVYDGVAYGSDTVAVNIAERTRTTTGLNETWESGVFQPYWVTDGRNGGLNEITSSYTPTRGGSYHLIQRATAYYGLSELILFTNLNALDNVYLDFWHKRYTSDSISNMPVSFTGSQDYDGVAISNDGNTWYRVTPSSWNTYTSYTKNSYRLDTISGVTMNSKVLIKFQRYDYYYSGYYFGWDDIELYRNRTPVAEAGDFQQVNEGTLVTLTGSGSSDPDGDTLTYTWTKTVGPKTITLSNPNAANPTFTAPSPIWADETYTFQLQVCDPRGLCSTDTVNVVVKDSVPNTVPTVNAGADLNKVEWEYVTITAVGSDSDGGPSTLTYSWTQTGGPTVVGLSGQNTATINFRTPLVTAGGQTVTFQVQVYDGVAYGSDTVAVNIAERTRTTTGLNETWESGVFQPYWVTDGRNGGLNEITSSYTPTHGGSYHLIQRATAYYGLSELILFTNLNALDNVYLDFWHKRYTSDSISNMPVSFTGSQDYDGVAISNDGNTWYRVTPSSWNTYTSYTKNSYRLDTISGVTMNSKVLIKFQRYDYYYSGYYFGWDDIRVYRDLPPTANAGSDQQVNEGALVTLHGEGSSDPDGEALTYAWTQIAGTPTLTLTGATTANPTFTAPSPIWGNKAFTFQLQVCDGSNGHCATDTVVITVLDSIPNVVPVANAGPDKNAMDLEWVELDATSSNDPDQGPNTALQYTWTQTLGTPVVIVNDYDGHMHFRAPYTLYQHPESLTFQVEVCDGMDCGTDTVTVTVGDRPAKAPDYTEGFEAGSWNTSWVHVPTNKGRTRVWNTFSPYAGTYHLLMDSEVDTAWSLNQFILFADLEGKSNVYFEFYHKHFNDEGQQMPPSFSGTSDTDGVAISVDGVNWYKLIGLTPAEGTTASWKQFSASINARAAQAGITLTKKTLIKIQQYGSYGISADGFAIDNVRLYTGGSCTPDCSGRTCGDDGCGGSCGFCNDNNPCTNDTCDSGDCVYEALPVGSACDDGLYCTVNTTCNASAQCTGGVPRNCDDGLYCTGTESCDEVNDQCVSAGDPCAGGTDCNKTCNEAADNCYDLAGTTCGSPASGPCDTPDSCNGSGVCLANYATAGTVCRVAAGACDTPEYCSGLSADCPADAFLPDTTLCRASGGDCDIAEYCSGDAADCPSDMVRPNTDLCRAAVDFCDLAEYCDGTSKDCPADGFKASNVVCRPADGFCDTAEFCPGDSPFCPNDGFKASTEICRLAEGDCDVAEYCPGSSRDCPNDAVRDETFVCRAAEDDCDIPEYCDGSSKICPVLDLVADTAHLCRPVTGDCDVEETCDGTNKACPPDDVVANGITCRIAIGECDVPEACDGLAGTCPADGFRDDTFVCRGSAGACDKVERCTGSSAFCPGDELKGPSDVCRQASGPCDAPEYCSGNDLSCPADLVRDAGEVCRPAAGDCDIAETCDGEGKTCPADAFLGAEVECRPAIGECDIAEYCLGNGPSCPANAFLDALTSCRPPVDLCDAEEFCTGSSAYCPWDYYKMGGTVCREPADLCDETEYCSGYSVQCPVNRFKESGSVCRPYKGSCDAGAEYCDGEGPQCPVEDNSATEGQQCDDGNPLTETSVCHDGRCVGTETSGSCDTPIVIGEVPYQDQNNTAGRPDHIGIHDLSCGEKFQYFPDTVYSFTAELGKRYEVTLTNLGEFVGRVMVKETCADSTVCLAAGPDVVTFEPSEGGTYYIIVESTDYFGGEFILSVTAEEIPDFEYPDDDAFTDGMTGDEDELLTDETADEMTDEAADTTVDDGTPTDHDLSFDQDLPVDHDIADQDIYDADQWQPDTDTATGDDAYTSDDDELLTDETGNDADTTRPKNDGCGCSLMF